MSDTPDQPHIAYLGPTAHTAELRKWLSVALAALTTPQLRAMFAQQMSLADDGPTLAKLRGELHGLLRELEACAGV